MPYGFAAYEFLAYVVPGGILLIVLMVLFPAVRTFFGRDRMDVGGLGMFLIVSFAFGQALQTVGAYAIEKPLIILGYAHQTDLVLSPQQKLIDPEIRTSFVEKANEFRVSVTTLNPENPEDVLKWRNLIRRVHSKINQEKLSDRLEIYGQHYAVNMNAATAFILALIIITAVIFTRRHRSRWLKGIKVVVVPPPVTWVIIVIY